MSVRDDFSYFLNGFDPENDGLAKMALSNFRDSSGLSPEILEKEQIQLFSGNRDKLLEYLGFASFGGQDILRLARLVEIPSFSPDGQISDRHFRSFPPINGCRYLHRKGNAARPYILPEIWNIKGKPNKPIWITEGAKKVLKLVQHGRASLGLQGVWNFRGAEEETFLFNELEQFTWKGRTAYLVFDMDLWTNPQVRLALYEFAFKLKSKGAVMRFPKWSGEKGIDEHLVREENPEEALVALEDNALTLENFISAEHMEELFRALKLTQHTFNNIALESLVNTVSKKLKIRPKTIFAKLREEKGRIVIYTEEEKKEARALLLDPHLVERFLEACHTRYLGRDKTLLLVKLSTLTRHFDRGLSVVLSGLSTVGKSYLIETVLTTCTPVSFENFTRTSSQYLLYRQEPLDHRIVTYFELQGAGQTAEIIRTALSEGSLRLGTVLKDASGSLRAEQIEKCTKGLVILSTHTGYHLDQELRTRVLTQEMLHNGELAREVYRRKAERERKKAKAEIKDEDTEVFKIWQVADSIIEPRPVSIPFLPQLAEFFPTDQERYHRDFDKMVILIKASALWHQHQRQVNEDGAIVADRRDYELIYSLSDIFTENVLPVSQPVMSFLNLIKDNCDMTREEAQEALSVSDKTLRRYISAAIDAGFLETCGRGPDQTFKIIEMPKTQRVLPPPEKIF